MTDTNPWLQLVPMHHYNARTGLGPIAAILLLAYQPGDDERHAQHHQHSGEQQTQDAANA